MNYILFVYRNIHHMVNVHWQLSIASAVVWACLLACEVLQLNKTFCIKFGAAMILKKALYSVIRIIWIKCCFGLVDWRWLNNRKTLKSENGLSCVPRNAMLCTEHAIWLYYVCICMYVCTAHRCGTECAFLFVYRSVYGFYNGFRYRLEQSIFGKIFQTPKTDKAYRLQT